jgi:magnesium-protoporphyrin O-methyltransferase
MAGYAATRDRVEAYFDRSATEVWARLTSDAEVSRIRRTVRAGRDAMRALILSRLPDDLRGARVLDAGCGTGALCEALARRGADVVAVDLSPQLLAIAADRLDPVLRPRVDFRAGDLLLAAEGRFDAVVAMDSLIYYSAADIARILTNLTARTAGPVVFTVAPRTPLLWAMWQAGKLFPRADRSPVMVPQTLASLRRASGLPVTRAGRIARGFYISECLEARP